MDRKLQEQLNKDIKNLHQPGLKLLVDDSIRVEGVYKIFDNRAVLQGEYNIRIILPLKYPFGFPLLYELSNNIPRIIDRHIDDSGLACVELKQKRILIGKVGITLMQFITNYVHRFLCWQLLYDEDPTLLDEWPHDRRATLQFYQEIFDVHDSSDVLMFLAYVALNLKPNGNCPCGSYKPFEKCHLKAFEYILPLGYDEIVDNINSIVKLKRTGEARRAA